MEEDFLRYRLFCEYVMDASAFVCVRKTLLMHHDGGKSQKKLSIKDVLMFGRKYEEICKNSADGLSASCIAAQANAVDFKIKGRWISLFDYGQNGNMTGGNGSTGYAKGFDNFEALQRWRIQLDAVASENLSGTVHFEIGKHRWGQASTGGQLGSDSNMVRLKHAYIDWRVPETDLKLRMGIQAINLPGFATDSQVMGSDVAGITASYTFNDNVGLTAFWARAYNDNFLGSDDDAPNNKQNFMDNVDFFGLVLPLTFEGARITPWVMGGMIGPNAFRTQDAT